MALRILGIDPGSRYLGYGLIERDGSRLRYLEADRLVLGNAPLTERLLKIDRFFDFLFARVIQKERGRIARP